MNFTTVLAPRSPDDPMPWLTIAYEPEQCFMATRGISEADMIEVFTKAEIVDMDPCTICF